MIVRSPSEPRKTTPRSNNRVEVSLSGVDSVALPPGTPAEGVSARHADIQRASVRVTGAGTVGRESSILNGT